MTYERFNKIGNVFKSKVSISKTGIISFSEGARVRLGIASNIDKFAALYYDKEKLNIGILFLPTKDQQGVATVRYRASGFSISAKSFLEFYGLTPGKTIPCEMTTSTAILFPNGTLSKSGPQILNPNPLPRFPLAEIHLDKEKLSGTKNSFTDDDNVEEENEEIEEDDFLNKGNAKDDDLSFL